MIELNELKTFLRDYHVEQISDAKWKYQSFEISFSNGMVVIEGKFFYPLAKLICSTPCYLNTLFLSEDKKYSPFEYFLTSADINDNLAVISDCIIDKNYQHYLEKYNNYRLKLVNLFISSGKSNELFLERVFITNLSTLHEILLNIS